MLDIVLSAEEAELAAEAAAARPAAAPGTGGAELVGLPPPLFPDDPATLPATATTDRSLVCVSVEGEEDEDKVSRDIVVCHRLKDAHS